MTLPNSFSVVTKHSCWTKPDSKSKNSSNNDVIMSEPEVKGSLKEQCVYMSSFNSDRITCSSRLKPTNRMRPRVHIAHLYLRRPSFSRTPTPTCYDSDDDDDGDVKKSMDDVINFNSLANPLRTERERMRESVRSAAHVTSRGQGFTDYERKLFNLRQTDVSSCSSCFAYSTCSCNSSNTSNRSVSATHVVHM